MVWQQWLYVALSALSVVFTVLYIGKPRQPYTPATAVASLIMSALLVWLVLSI